MSSLDGDTLVEPLAPAPGRIARNAGARLVGELIAKLATLAFFVITARAVGAGDFGEFTFALSLASLLVIGAGLGTEDLMAREIARDRGALDRMFRSIVSLKVATSGAILGATWLVLWAVGFSGEALVVFALVATGTALDNLQRTWHSVFEAYERMQLTSWSLIVQRIATALGAALAIALGGSIVAVSAVYLAGSALGVGAAERQLRRGIARPAFRVGAADWWPLARGAAAIGALSVASTLLLRLDTTILGFFEGTDNGQVGVYGAAFRLLEATLFLSWSFGSAVLPWFARAGDDAPERRRDAFALALKAICSTLLPIGLAFTLYADPIIRLLYGSGYVGAVVPLRWLGAATFFLGVQYLVSRVLIARGRPGLFLRGLAVASVASLVADVILIPAYGADGAGAASAVTAFTLALASLVQIRRLLGPIRWRRAFAGTLLAGAAMTACALVIDAPALLSGALALAAYAAVLFGTERLAFDTDVALLRDALRRGR